MRAAKSNPDLEFEINRKRQPPARRRSHAGYVQEGCSCGRAANGPKGSRNGSVSPRKVASARSAVLVERRALMTSQSFATAGHESVCRSRRVLSRDELRMMSVPSSSDIDPQAEPDVALLLRVFDELPQGMARMDGVPKKIHAAL